MKKEVRKITEKYIKERGGSGGISADIFSIEHYDKNSLTFS